MAKDNKRENFDVTIAPSDGHAWSKEERALIQERAKLLHGQRTPERIRKYAVLAVLYRIQNDKNEVESDNYN